MVDWVNDTGCKRSSYDTEAERKPFKPQKQSATSTGYTSQLAGILADTVMEQAMTDKAKEAQIEAEQEQWRAQYASRVAKERGEETAADGEDGEPSPDEDRGAGNDDDSLEALRERRRKQMREAQAKREKHRALGHGTYDEIAEDEFLKTVTSSERCIVHFYHRNFERCKIMDMHLGKCARKFFGTRFVKLDSEKAPFFVDKLKVRTLPCVIVFSDGVAKGRQVGFNGLEGGDELSTSTLAFALKELGGMEEDFGEGDEV